MNPSFTKIHRIAAGAAVVAACVLWVSVMSRADGEEVGVEVKRVSEEKLANVPGKKLTVIRVNYAPGGKSGAHRHAGSVFAYVLWVRSDRRTPPPARRKSTRPAKAFSSGPEVGTS